MQEASCQGFGGVPLIAQDIARAGGRESLPAGGGKDAHVTRSGSACLPVGRAAR